MPAIEEPRILFTDPVCAYSLWRNVMISYLKRPMNLDRIKAFRAAQRETSRLPDPIACLMVNEVDENAGPEGLGLSEEMRGEVVAALKAYNDRDLAVAMCLEGAGWVHATARTFVSGVVLFARPRYATKIFGDRRDGAKWLVERIRGGRPPFSAQDLLDAAAATGRRIGT